MLSLTSQGLGAAGTTGTVDGPSNLKKGVGFWYKLESLTNAGEYILVPTASLGLSNVTFTATGAAMTLGPYKATATGSLTVTLYGAASGVASGSALDTWEASITQIGTGLIDTSAFTDLIAFFLPILIVVGVVMAFKFRDKFTDMK